MTAGCDTHSQGDMQHSKGLSGLARACPDPLGRQEGVAAMQFQPNAHDMCCSGMGVPHPCLQMLQLILSPNTHQSAVSTLFTAAGNMLQQSGLTWGGQLGNQILPILQEQGLRHCGILVHPASA